MQPADLRMYGRLTAGVAGPQVLAGLKLTADQFVDLCILCGCDYVGTIKGALLHKVQTLRRREGEIIVQAWTSISPSQM